MIVGSKGILRVKDFIVDWNNSGFFEQPNKPLKFEVFYGRNIDPAVTFNIGPHDEAFEPLRQPRSLMFETFAKDANNEASYAKWSAKSSATQRIVDAMFT